jgi:molybdopterin synthase catalytic subunit
MARIRVQTADFDIGAEFGALTGGRSDIGGIGCFVGTVRSNAQDRVAAMTLEHYPAMTLRAITAITEEAERRWNLLVLAAAAHRQPALDATAFLIDWLKTRAPFWKKEEFADGGVNWVEARATDDAAAARWSGAHSRA